MTKNEPGMLNIFENLKSFLKTKPVNTEGVVLRLHSGWTVLFLLSASILLSARQFLGEPINCIVGGKDEQRIKAVETFCWMQGTYILPEAWNATVGVQVPYPGIDTSVKGQPKTYHAYYQWVALMLFFEACVFYFPKYLWKCWEANKIKELTMDLHDPLLEREKLEASVKLLVRALREYWGHNASYLRCYIFCEILCLVNVIAQIVLLDKFLDGAFVSFGIEVIKWSEWEQEYRNDPLVRAFPRMTKCLFYDFGPSGDPQKEDSICLLSLNVLNEKIFIFLWFWLLILLIVIAFTIMVHICLIVYRSPRYRGLAVFVKVGKNDLSELFSKAGAADWFILCLLADSISAVHYRMMIKQLADAMRHNKAASIEVADDSGSCNIGDAA